MATSGRPAAASKQARAGPARSRARPAPKRASTTSSAPARLSGARGTGLRRHFPAITAASPRRRDRSPNRATRTAAPARARWRAMTKPSPPLLPGPASTRVGRGPKRARISAAAAAPAASISRTPSTPAAMASRSAAYISSTERSACRPAPLIDPSPLSRDPGAARSAAPPDRRRRPAGPGPRGNCRRRSASRREAPRR